MPAQHKLTINKRPVNKAISRLERMRNAVLTSATIFQLSIARTLIVVGAATLMSFLHCLPPLCEYLICSQLLLLQQLRRCIAALPLALMQLMQLSSSCSSDSSADHATLQLKQPRQISSSADQRLGQWATRAAAQRADYTARTAQALVDRPAANSAQAADKQLTADRRRTGIVHRQTERRRTRSVTPPV